MKKVLLILLSVIYINACTTEPPVLVKNIEELNLAIESAQPGDQIVMANGVWQDVEIKFKGSGTEQSPIVIKAETPGEVFIEGESSLSFGGDYLIVDGLFFRNGHGTSRAVINFRIGDKVANHCTLVNSVILEFNQPERDMADHWVEFHGRHNTLDRCYLAGKSNRGPTVRVVLRGNESIWNYHQITNNHFGPRPRKGGPSAETIQIGTSSSSVSPSFTMVANNLFDRCNGEVEVISSKTNYNEFRNNVFFQSEGSLVTRHGNYCIIDGNYFIGDGSDNIGGVRLINTGHWVTNNYFYNLKGEQFRSPLAVMNGIPKSPQNRYNQVTDAVVAYNTWINCESPWHFGVGQNLGMKDVLPASEIRSARPERTIVANNIVFNESALDNPPVIAHDKIDGINFKSNVINQGYEGGIDGLEQTDFGVIALTEFISVPDNGVSEVVPYAGFEFDKIDADLFGTSRANTDMVGSVIAGSTQAPDILNPANYGTNWYNPIEEKETPETYMVEAGGDIASAIATAKAGDIILLNEGEYAVGESLVIDKELKIKSESGRGKIQYNGAVGTPLFELNPKGSLEIDNLELTGNSNYAFATLKKGMSAHFNLKIENSAINNFDYVLKAYKQSFADSITLINTIIADCANGLELSEETNDKGDYNAEFITIIGSEFRNIGANVIDYYRGGYDESTVGGNLLIKDSKFMNCGGNEKNGILLNHRGIINVNLMDNQFEYNPVRFVSILWGAKNNYHSGNEVKNSGEIRTEENIKLTLMY